MSTQLINYKLDMICKNELLISTAGKRKLIKPFYTKKNTKSAAFHKDKGFKVCKIVHCQLYMEVHLYLRLQYF